MIWLYIYLNGVVFCLFYFCVSKSTRDEICEEYYYEKHKTEEMLKQENRQAFFPSILQLLIMTSFAWPLGIILGIMRFFKK